MTFKARIVILCLVWFAAGAIFAHVAEAGVLCGFRQFSDHECRAKTYKRVSRSVSHGEFNRADSEGRGHSEESSNSERSEGSWTSRDYNGPDPESIVDEGKNVKLCHRQKGDRHFWNYHGREYYHDHLATRTTRTKLVNPALAIQAALCNTGLTLNLLKGI